MYSEYGTLAGGSRANGPYLGTAMGMAKHGVGRPWGGVSARQIST